MLDQWGQRCDEAHQLGLAIICDEVGDCIDLPTDRLRLTGDVLTLDSGQPWPSGQTLAEYLASA